MRYGYGEYFITFDPEPPESPAWVTLSWDGTGLEPVALSGAGLISLYDQIRALVEYRGDEAEVLMAGVLAAAVARIGGEPRDVLGELTMTAWGKHVRQVSELVYSVVE